MTQCCSLLALFDKFLLEFNSREKNPFPKENEDSFHQRRTISVMFPFSLYWLVNENLNVIISGSQNCITSIL